MLKCLPRSTGAPEWPRPADMPALLHRLLRLRGVRSEEEARAFLCPGRDQLRDPFLLSDMEQAVQEIRAAIDAGEGICVYGDYDVDGVCASSILSSYLRSIGAQVDVYLPSRHKEGYGLNEGAVLKVCEKHRLLVTVDCGITSVELTKLAQARGMRVVITDHHRPEGELPPCPVVNPLLNNYPFPYLCGAGVVFQLVAALGGRDAAMDYVDLAALATIADIVPLQDENRAIAALGLKRINVSPRPGIRALIDASGMTGRVISSGNVAFQLAPRLNASGRLGDAMRAYRLLTGTNADECAELAGQLNEENLRRKALEQDAYALADELLRAFRFAEHRVIVIPGEGLNSGVIGLAASRLTERYHYPTVVLSLDGDVYTGSCRSIDGVDIHDALSHVADTLIQFGGHKMAAGLRLKKENLDAFRDGLDAYLKETYPAELWIPRVEYDCEVDVDDLTPEAVEMLEALAPTGCGNPSAQFLMKCEIASARPVGADGAHLKLSLRSAGGMTDAIWFRRGDLAGHLPRTADVVFQATVNRYQGRVSVQAQLTALEARDGGGRLSGLDARADSLFQTFLTDHVYNWAYSEIPAPTISAQALREKLAGRVQGVLIVAASIDGARAALEAADDLPLDVFVGEYPSDARCFHSLAVLPAGTPPEGYDTIVLAGIPDGLMNASFHLEGVPVSPLFARMPGLESLRGIYAAARRVSRRPSHFLARDALVRGIAEEADESESVCAAGLFILSDMALLTIEDTKTAGFRVTLPPLVKRDPAENPWFRRMQGWREQAMKGR